MEHMKQEPSSQVYTVDNNRNSYTAPPTNNKPWKAGTLHNVPYKGLFALVISIAGVIASIGILIVSNHDPVSSWSVQPTVWLAVASTITNMFLAYALRKAVDVAWWKKATSDGTKIAHLHRTWEYGTSVGHALLSGLHVNKVAIGCILVAIAPINGPLLQRASRVTTGFAERHVDVKVSIADKLPEGYSGFTSGRAHAVAILTPDFTKVVQEAGLGLPINFTSQGCKGDCSTTIRGAGFAVNCSTDEADYSMEEELGGDSTRAFGSTFLWDFGSPGQINLGVQFKDKPDCTGKLQIRNCTLQASVVDYPVIINGNDSTISLDPKSDMFEDKIISKTDYALLSTTNGAVALGGLNKALKDSYDSSADLGFKGAIGYQLDMQGGVANSYAIIPKDEATGGANCQLTFSDPSKDLLAATRDLMFRAAIAASSPTTSQTVHALESQRQPIYESHFLYLGLATAFSGIALIAVFPSFLGWWAVGRKTSLSPIETAKAFRAPMLMGTDPNAEAKEIVKSVGDRGVKYGVVSGEGADWLGMSVPELVRRPGQGERFVG